MHGREDWFLLNVFKRACFLEGWSMMKHRYSGEGQISPPRKLMESPVNFLEYAVAIVGFGATFSFPQLHLPLFPQGQVVNYLLYAAAGLEFVRLT